MMYDVVRRRFLYLSGMNAAAAILRSSSKARSTKKLISLLPLISPVSGFATASPLFIRRHTTSPKRNMASDGINVDLEDDPYLFLEEVESPESLAFATEANEKCLAALGDPSETQTYKRYD